MGHKENREELDYFYGRREPLLDEDTQLHTHSGGRNHSRSQWVVIYEYFRWGAADDPSGHFELVSGQRYQSCLIGHCANKDNEIFMTGLLGYDEAKKRKRELRLELGVCPQLSAIQDYVRSSVTR